jgi:hypothetical protein
MMDIDLIIGVFGDTVQVGIALPQEKKVKSRKQKVESGKLFRPTW